MVLGGAHTPQGYHGWVPARCSLPEGGPGVPPSLVSDTRDSHPVSVALWCPSHPSFLSSQDHDFLEEEQFFLETLKKASYTTSSLSD